MKKKFLFTLIFLAASLAVPAFASANTQTFSTPGTYSVAVPPYLGTMQITVNGAAGGGGGGTLMMAYGCSCSGTTEVINGGYYGQGGGFTYAQNSTFGTMGANGGSGGGGGLWPNSSASAGASGSAYGGNVSNITGGGNAGGAGGLGVEGDGRGGPGGPWEYVPWPYQAYYLGGSGGAGGQTVSTFAQGALTPGSVITIVVGSGGTYTTPGSSGSGGQDKVNGVLMSSLTGQPGASGSPGSVVLTWTAAPDSPPSAPTITGPSTVTINSPTTFAFNSTSPFGYALHYGVDWNNDGVVDNWYPAAATSPSGSSYNVTHTWASNGTVTFQVLAQDTGLLNSAWTSKTITVSPPSQQPLTCVSGVPEVYVGNNTYPRTVPQSFISMAVQVYGAGGGGSGASAGIAGGNSSFASLLATGGGAGSGATAGTGGTGSGGSVNRTNGAGQTSSRGGFGGYGGWTACNCCSCFNGGNPGFEVAGGDGFSPGGGDSGGLSYGVPGAGGGGFTSQTFTPATLTPGSAVSVVVGKGGTGGAAGGTKLAGGAGGNGYVSFTCTPVAPSASITTDAPFINGAYNINAGSTVHVTATYAPASGDALTASAINGYSGATSMPCTDIAPYNASCWTVADMTKTYTFSTTTQGSYTFYAAMQTTNFPTYTNRASLNIYVNPAPALSINANGQANSLTIPSGQSANITWGANYVQTSSGSGILYPTGANWIVPLDWNSSNNTIEVIGGGGGGYSDTLHAGAGGGGGGAYAKITNFVANPGDIIPITVGTGGASGIPGGDTMFKNSSTLLAKGGAGATGPSGGAGGSSGLSVGTLVYAGGNGGSGTGDGSTWTTRGGGGGAGGPNGAGSNGGNGGASSIAGNGGGGGNGGGTSGANGPNNNGGAGGNNSSGTGGGMGGTTFSSGVAGTSGGGGGGGANGGCGGAGGNGREWDSTHGSGGGAGGGCNPSAGLYGGGGGGGSTAGAGAQGVIVINYAHTILGYQGCMVSNSGDSTQWFQNSEGTGKSTGPLTSNRTYVLNCNDLQGNPTTPANVGISMLQVSLPVLDPSSLVASPLRVRAGATSTISWKVNNLAPGTTCGITPALSTGIATWDGSGTSWVGGPVVTNPINRPTQFVLTCTNLGTSVSTSVTVGLIPAFQEL